MCMAFNQLVEEQNRTLSLTLPFIQENSCCLTASNYDNVFFLPSDLDWNDIINSLGG